MKKKINAIIAGLSLCVGLGLNASDTTIELNPDKYVLEKNTSLDAFSDENVPTFLANDIIPEEQRVSVNITKLPEHGTLDVDPFSGQFVYVPELDFVGTDTCEYALFLCPQKEQTESVQVQFVVEDGSGAPGDVQITVGSHFKIKEKIDDIKRAFVKINGRRFRVRVKPNENGSEVIFSRKFFKNRLNISRLNPDLSPKEGKLVLVNNNGEKEIINIEFNIPKINDIDFGGDTIFVNGKFFGRRPKVALVNTSTGKVFKLRINKKLLRFTTVKGKKVCMDINTGDSQLVVSLKKQLPPATYKLIIQNAISCGVDEETLEIPEIVIE